VSEQGSPSEAGLSLDVATPGLEAHGVWLRYSRRRPWALAGADVVIPAGSLVALVGPNAAGKTTLIRSWLGFERPERGGVRVLGRDPAKDPEGVLLSTAYVAQDPALYSGLSCREHHRFAASLRSGFDVVAAEAAVAKAGVPLDVKAGTLSGGQRVQLALSIARGCNARILLLDEPLANLDPIARRAVIRTLAEYAADGNATVLVSSHLVSDLEGAFDYIVAMGNGKILLSGGVTEVTRRYVVEPVRPADVAGPQELGRFVARDGQLTRVLWSGTASHPGRRPATLEEVILSILAGSQTGALP
jgi:ABC-2 type transport system ATP-binding protein